MVLPLSRVQCEPTAVASSAKQSLPTQKEESEPALKNKCSADDSGTDDEVEQSLSMCAYGCGSLPPALMPESSPLVKSEESSEDEDEVALSIRPPKSANRLPLLNPHRQASSDPTPLSMVSVRHSLSLPSFEALDP